MKIRIYGKINGREEQLLTVRQTATKLKITKQAVIKMINAGRVRAIRYDAFFLIPLSDLKKIQTK